MKLDGDESRYCKSVVMYGVRVAMGQMRLVKGERGRGSLYEKVVIVSLTPEDFKRVALDVHSRKKPVFLIPSQLASRILSTILIQASYRGYRFRSRQSRLFDGS